MQVPHGDFGLLGYQGAVYRLIIATASVQFSCSVVSNSLRPHGLQHARLRCPSPTPGACSNSCPLRWQCHPTISFSVSSSPHTFSLSQHKGLFKWVSSFQWVTSGGQSIGVSASASLFPINTQEWFPLGLTGWISLQSKGLSNTTVQKHQFFSAQLSL